MSSTYNCDHPMCRASKNGLRGKHVCLENPSNLRFVSTTSGRKLLPGNVYLSSDRSSLALLATAHADIWLRYFPGRQAMIGIPTFPVDLENSKKACYASGLFVVDNIDGADLYQLVREHGHRLPGADPRIIRRYGDADYFRTVQAFFQLMHVRHPAFTRRYTRSITPDRMLA